MKIGVAAVAASVVATAATVADSVAANAAVAARADAATAFLLKAHIKRSHTLSQRGIEKTHSL